MRVLRQVRDGTGGPTLRRGGLLACLIAAAFALTGLGPATAAPTEASEPFTVYLSPDGSDDAAGTTPGTPVATLKRAQEVLFASDPSGDVEVRIEQGVYVSPTTVWTFYVPRHSVSFLPIDYEPGDGYGDIAGRPVFRGDGSAGYWLSARLPSGHPGGNTNLDFRYLEVQHYSSGGLQLFGGVRKNADGITVPKGRGVNGNVVYGMMFRNLGSAHVPASTGYGGLNTWNSSNNLVRNNHFVNNENKSSEAGLMHGVYLAHHSDDNVVVSNRFESVSGGPMRTRNDSNGNDVYGNRFIRAGDVGYSEWFCDQKCVDDHPGHGRECASHGNYFHDNALVSAYDGGSLAMWKLMPSGLEYPGGPGCDNENQRRLRTWNNT